jgi:hypothetical protein
VVKPHDNSACDEEGSDTLFWILREYSTGHNALSRCGFDRGLTRGNKRIGRALLVFGIGSNLFLKHTYHRPNGQQTYEYGRDDNGVERVYSFSYCGGVPPC